VNIDQLVNRRTVELYSSTRAEVLGSISAALLFVAVIAWRFAPTQDRVQLAALGLALAWAAISVYRFRDRIWLRRHPPVDGVAATGLEYYRNELVQRRQHLKNAWIWHGPLILASTIFMVSFAWKAFPGRERLLSVLPLVLVLAIWTAFGIRRRWREAKALEREIDEISAL
jgi:hypothetical protein